MEDKALNLQVLEMVMVSLNLKWLCRSLLLPVSALKLRCHEMYYDDRELSWLEHFTAAAARTISTTKSSQVDKSSAGTATCVR